MRIGNTDFNPEEIRKMKLSEFCDHYRGVISTDLRETYYKVTGFKAPTAKEKAPKEDKAE